MSMTCVRGGGGDGGGGCCTPPTLHRVGVVGGWEDEFIRRKTPRTRWKRSASLDWSPTSRSDASFASQFMHLSSCISVNGTEIEARNGVGGRWVTVSRIQCEAACLHACVCVERERERERARARERERERERESYICISPSLGRRCEGTWGENRTRRRKIFKPGG